MADPKAITGEVVVTPEIERVARALHRRQWERRSEMAPPFERDAEHYCSQAIAAMEALMSPSEEMRADMQRAFLRGGPQQLSNMFTAAMLRALGRTGP